MALGVTFGLIAAQFTGSPAVGQWRSLEGRAAYDGAYDEAMRSLPPPTMTRDMAVRQGVVRVYAWTSPDHAGTTPVLLLPGRTSGTPMWAEQVTALAAARDVYAVDALGDAGRSSQIVPLNSFADQATWVVDTLDGLGLPAVHLVGHSFGGATAAEVAQAHPERVASLTLLEPVFTLAHPPASLFWWATVAMLPVPQSWRDHALARIGGVSVEEVRTDDPMSRMIALGAEHYAAALPTPSVRTDDDLSALTMPTYVAVAERDSLAGGEKATDRARLIPRGRVEVWPDTTHSLPMQVGTALTDRLATWWDSLEP